MNAQIVLTDVGVRLPNRTLFEGVEWTLYDGDRIALAGRNGCGKSTLLRILAGAAEATMGDRIAVGGGRYRIAFLDQTKLEDAATEFHAGENRAVSPVDYLATVLHTNEEGEDRRWEIRKILGGLGFTDPMMDGSMAELSGGWLLRVFLAGTLLDRPDVLLLDEPTNHLDIGSIQWLEAFLTREFQGTLVLVTHDVALQRRTTNTLAAIHGGRFFYRKDSKDYLAFRAALGDESELLRKKIEALGKQVEANYEFARKFKAKAALASRAQSKVKMAESQEEEIAELKARLIQVEGAAYNLNFRFRMDKQGSRFPVSLQHASFRYSDSAPWIFQNLTLEVKRGQRIAILGDNGGGKTTLLNILGGRMPPKEGKRSVGHEAEVGYFGQHQIEELSLDNTVLENLRSRSKGVGDQQLRGWLGAFGFRGDEEVGKRAKVLSGGEKARLALLRILASPVNLVLLDEPTNHLDIETKELLKEALATFEGTSIFVSHDREFVSAVADRIIFVTPDRKWIDHLGTLDTFCEKYPELVSSDGKDRKPTAQPKSAEAAVAKPKGEGISFEERKKLKNRAKTLERTIGTLEGEMAKLSAEKENTQAYDRIAALDAESRRKMVEWEKASTELEEIRGKISL